MQLNEPCNEVAYISYNMVTRGLPDIYTLALGSAAPEHQVYISGKTTLAYVITYTYIHIIIYSVL